MINHHNTNCDIDRATLDRWVLPYTGWHYWPDYVISNKPDVHGYENFYNADVPCIYQLPESLDRWYMSFIAFDGNGYNSFVAESDDLIHWENARLAMGFGKEGEFDYGGRVTGAYLYESYDIMAPRILKRQDGRFWTLFGCYPKQGGYEIDPGYEGIASSVNGLIWQRAKDSPVLSVYDSDVGEWEKDCIYQPWLLEHNGIFYNFYNAKKMPEWIEQIGIATSSNLLDWKRFEGNPVIRVRPGHHDENFLGDGKVYWDDDHWVMFYVGVSNNRTRAHIMIAFSYDLLHWTSHPDPLYVAGGHPDGLDEMYAHKISLVYNSLNSTFYLYYCACNSKGRGIGLLTSRPIVAK